MGTGRITAIAGHHLEKISDSPHRVQGTDGGLQIRRRDAHPFEQVIRIHTLDE